MTHAPSSAYEELGGHKRERGTTPATSNLHPRPVPTIDQELLNYPKDNEFTRWLAKQKGSQ